MTTDKDAPAAAEPGEVRVVERTFVNELGNRIKITIEGPISTAENILTEVEAKHLSECLSAALAATRPAEAQAVAEGWKLVPVDPTEAMCVAGCREDDILGELVDWRGPDTTTREVVANLYRTMLAASPATGGA